MAHIIRRPRCFCVSSPLEHLEDTMHATRLVLLRLSPRSLAHDDNRNLGDNKFRSFKAGILDGLGSLTSL